MKVHTLTGNYCSDTVELDGHPLYWYEDSSFEWGVSSSVLQDNLAKAILVRLGRNPDDYEDVVNNVLRCLPTGKSFSEVFSEAELEG